MSFLRGLASIVLPPLGVIDRGRKNFIVVLILSIAGFWISGVIAALFINADAEKRKGPLAFKASAEDTLRGIVAKVKEVKEAKSHGDEHNP
jgi:uncharacterized membrane protein YqaE (UPF0057 family)